MSNNSKYFKLFGPECQKWIWLTSHDEGRHDVIPPCHCSFDEGREAPTIPYFCVDTRKVVQEIHHCADMTCKVA